MILLITAIIFYLFCFFLPALKLKYEGISDSLATKLNFSYDASKKLSKPDSSKIAAIEQCNDTDLEKRLIYKGEKNCRLFHKIYGSEYKNPKICIGFGDCVKVCPQEAIKIRNNRAEISEFCNACGKCIDICPENIISLVPRPKKSEENRTRGFKFWAACYKLLSVVRG